MRGWLRETAGGLPRTFWYLWTGNLINRSGAFVTILLTFYLNRDRGFSPAYVGLVVGLIGAGGAVGGIAGGHLSDRWGRRRTLLLAQSGTTVMLLAMGVSHQLWLIAGVGVLLGLTQNMARPVYSAMMVDVVPAADRMRAFTLNYWANNLAFTIASIVGGLVADLNYFLIFVVDAATTAAAAVLIFTHIGETKPESKVAPDGSVAARSPYTDRVFLGVCALIFLMMLVFMQYQTALPLAMAKDGLQARTYGIVVAINAVMIVLGQLFVPKLVKGWERSKTLALAAVIVGVGFGLTAFAHNAWLYAMTVVVWTVGEMVQSPANSTLISELSPAESRGKYQGLFSLTMSGAMFVAPLAGGFVFGHFGGAALWTGCLVLGLIAAVLNLMVGPSRVRRVEELKEEQAEQATA